MVATRLDFHFVTFSGYPRILWAIYLWLPVFRNFCAAFGGCKSKTNALLFSGEETRKAAGAERLLNLTERIAESGHANRRQIAWPVVNLNF